MKVKLPIFLTFALIIPCAYLIIRFNLFSEVNTIKIGFFGIVVFAILLGVLGILMKYYIEGLKTRYSLIKQVLQGAMSIIFPLVVALLLLIWLKDNVTMVIEALCVLIPCEAIAIVINPLPKYCFDNNIEGIIDITDRIFKNKEVNK